MAGSVTSMISISNLDFQYGSDGFHVSVPEFSVRSGQATAIVGPSGSGKTTLLHLIAGILTPQRGTVQIDDFRVDSSSDAVRRSFRIQNVGLVFQEFELIDYLSVLDNVLLPFRLNAVQTVSADVKTRAVRLLGSVGLSEYVDRSVTQLSQGERQRVAICRALLPQPKVLLADEPTGNLDPVTSRQILELLIRSVREHDMTLAMVTHDHSLLDEFDDVVDFQKFLVTSGSAETSEAAS